MPLTRIKNTAIGDGGITTAKLADGSVTTVKVADSAVNSAKIGVDVIAAEDLAANSVTVSEITNGAVTSAKLATQTGNVDFADNGKIRLGDSQDLQIYHDGSNSYIIDNGTGDLIINTNGNAISLNPNSGGEYGLRVINNGAVNLYHDNALKLSTTATGVDVTGTMTADTLSLNSSTDFGIGTISSDGNWGMYFRSDNVGGSDPVIADFNFAGNANETRLRIGSGGDITFFDSTGVTQGLFWDASAQRLGLGTTSPATKLDVLGSINSGVRVSDGTTTGIFYASAEATNSIVVGTTTNHPLVLYTNNAPRMLIDSTGNVGIGTNNPSYPLSVRGSSSGQILAHLLNSAGTTNGDVTNVVRVTGGDNAYWANLDIHAYTTEFTQNGTRKLEITSTGKVNTWNRPYGFLNHNTAVSLADDASIVINAGTAGGGLLAIYETASGNNALFRVGYSLVTSSTILSQGGAGTTQYATTDTDGKVCVIGSNHTITIKNRLGGTRVFYINMFMAGNNFAG